MSTLLTVLLIIQALINIMEKMLKLMENPKLEKPDDDEPTAKNAKKQVKPGTPVKTEQVIS
ncbi:hypothetical protein P4V47_24785 [Brevibacillus laterosporus]|uniref:hypothetical protein n=1 Tax=Brevibacillus laterosporus TaxID=1465 RepID=UPI002E2008F4|nr:hypothetical protein [Brevibacillus laterosporus]